MKAGNIYSCEFSGHPELLAFTEEWMVGKDDHVLLFSRMPHRRLMEHIDIKTIEAYWLTERVTAGALAPSLEKIFHLTSSRVSNHKGLVIIEGLEWLVTLHGQDAVLGLIRNLSDEVHRKAWTIILPINPLAFDAVWLARLRREAPDYDITPQQDEVSVEETPTVPKDESPAQVVQEKEIEMDVIEDGTPRLIMLTRLPQVGFNSTLLTKRILQWRRMGLDVSELEPALYFDEEEKAYALYSVVEEKVRRAVELDKMLEQFKSNLSASELATARFRIRQLTGLDEIEASLANMLL